MNPIPLAADSRSSSPIKVTLVYVLLGVGWILFSNTLFAKGTHPSGGHWTYEALQDLMFVGLTATLLYVMVQRIEKRHLSMVYKLREGQERLDLALKSAHQGLYDLNVQTGETVVNESYATMLGYNPKEFRETNAAWRERLHPDDREVVYQVYSDYVSGRIDEYRVEFRQRTANGDWVWIFSAGRLVARDPQGRPLRMLGTHVDITHRKNSEQQLNDALAFVKTVLHSSPIGIIACGPDGRTVLANEAAARITGLKLPELLQHTIGTIEPWQKQGWKAAADEAMATGRKTSREGKFQNLNHETLWLSCRFIPFQYAGHQNLLVMVRDDTLARKNLDQLNLLKAAVDATPTGWVVTDAKGRIEWVNPGFTAMTGYTAQEAVGRNPRLLNSGRHPPGFYRELWRTVTEGEIWNGEIFNQRKDGSHYHEYMTVVPIKEAGGAIHHFVAIKQNITAQKNLEQQLARVQRLDSIGMLASGIAHDLNNVLTPILLSVELLRSAYPTPDEGQHVDAVKLAAQRGANIVRQILTFARGLEGAERSEIQPRYLLNDVLQLIQETFPRLISIRSAIQRDVLPVIGDMTQLHQVILNLAVNARDAMPSGGRLTLGAHNLCIKHADPARPGLAPGDHVVLTVTDTGTGITPEVQEHMFDPFFTTKPRGKGTGLGLSSAYGIVRSHGGFIEVKSKPGEGSEFQVILPAAPQTAINEIRTSVPAVPIRGRGQRVLVVDDENPIREIMKRVLESHGFQPVAAEDGVEALALFKAAPNNYSAVIIDMMMPRMSGTELIKALRQASPTLPLIVSTGLLSESPEPTLELELKALGVNRLLLKPFTENELIEAVDQEIKNRCEP
jgi:two-component system, cell cycle sensor histidine kinase and response regulator CckA